ncbi:hypothetical protein [Streptomyces griseoaurantiacus]|uniref:hypothetical protein n=1 Tax=Streptomyces griseoaurantiacus TaxID=68213 RepID=UPI00382FDE8E
MAGFGRVLGCLLVVGALAGCGSAVVGDSGRGDAQRMLDRRAGAVLERDREAFLGTESPTADPRKQLATGAAEFANLRNVPLASWSYRITSFRRTGEHATAGAELRYRVRGQDRAPVTSGRELRLVHRGRHWYVASDEPARKSGQQLWEQGPVRAVKGRRSLVLGVGQSTAGLRAYARLADEAVPAVSRAWGTGWAGRVVVYVPRSVKGMAGLLGSTDGDYRGIAAVTTGEAGGAVAAPADRVIVNPDAYGLLGDFGRQVVLTHETTHVATRAHTTAATPLWLSEGYADFVGYRGSDRTAAEVAPELREEVAAGRVPAALPADADFGFGQNAERLARAYEGGWLACRMIAERWGEERLRAFYRAVGAHGTRAGAVEDALRDVLHTDLATFTRDWRASLRDRLG